jgi:hypothetical protein
MQVFTLNPHLIHFNCNEISNCETELTEYDGGLHENLQSHRWSTIYLLLMERRIPLLCSQEPATGSFPDPVDYIPPPPPISYFSDAHINIIVPSTNFLKWFLVFKLQFCVHFSYFQHVIK